MECFKLPESYFGNLRERENEEPKRRAMAEMLEKASCQALRPNTYHSVMKDGQTQESFLERLSEEGVFDDLDQNRSGWSTAIKRLTCIVMAKYHNQKESDMDEIPKKLLRAMIYYGNQELTWENRGPVRFHDSCFALPVCAVNQYFALLPKLRHIEDQGALWMEYYNVLCGLMLQAWTLPERADATDQTPFCKTRFQDHVWWMGGNALAYRPIFYTALCFGDSRLMDVISDVIVEASASQTSKGEKAFWTEGICVDGFGWGHGPQAYNTGYPTDALREIFDIIQYFKGTAFEKTMERMDWNNILRYIRAISWSSYGTYIPPMMGRVCFSRKGRQTSTTEMMEDFTHRIAADFKAYVPSDALQKLEEAVTNGVCQVQDDQNEYHGTRYFFNNDTLISKNEKRYFYFNSASSRCKGVECAHEMADTRNFYIRDGSYILLTDPKSYEDVKGTYNPCHFPGTTERDIKKEEIQEETNWSGYNSIHNFAGGLGDGLRGVAGFIYEKDAGNYADGAGIVREASTKEMFGVKANKAVFVQDDLFVFLGAGIADRKPEYGRHIVTTVNNVRLKDAFWCDGEGMRKGELVTGRYDTKTSFLYNDGCFYGITLDPQTTLTVHAGAKMTDWRYLNFVNTDVANEELQVLELMLDHGEAPTQGAYSYWISAGQEKKPSEIEDSFRILGNREQVQAVCFEQNKVMAVFYQPSEIQWGAYALEVSAPCVMMLEQNKEGCDITLSDPCQNPELSTIVVSVKHNGRTQSAEVQMPAGKLMGSPCHVQLRHLEEIGDNWRD